MRDEQNRLLKINIKLLELEDANIEIDYKHIDTSFTTVYRDTSDNYTEEKNIFVR